MAEIESCYELGKGLQLGSQYDHVPFHVRLQLVRRWRRDKDRDPSCTRWNNAALRWVVRDKSLCDTYFASVEQALSTSNMVHSDLILDDWYESVMGIIQQVASRHFGVKSTAPRRHWVTPVAWNDILTRQAQISKLLEHRRALLQLDDSRSLVFFFCMWHITARLVVLDRRIRASCREAKAQRAANTCSQLGEL